MTFGPGKRGEKYGAAHIAERKRRAAAHEPWHPCTICGRPLGAMGPHLHLDHTADGLAYRGFAHRACNVSDGARRGAAKVNAKRDRKRPKPPFQRPAW